MFLLFLGLATLFTGLFTTYFGAGKSRVIGILLMVIGLLVFSLLYWLTTVEEVIESHVISAGIVAVVASVIALGVSIGIILIPMMFGEKEVIEDIESLAQEAVSEEEKPPTELPSDVKEKEKEMVEGKEEQEEEETKKEEEIDELSKEVKEVEQSEEEQKESDNVEEGE